MRVSAQLSAVAAALPPVFADCGFEYAHCGLQFVFAVSEVAIFILALPLQPILAQRSLPQLQLLLQLRHVVCVVAALSIGAGAQPQEAQAHQIPSITQNTQIHTRPSEAR